MPNNFMNKEEVDEMFKTMADNINEAVKDLTPEDRVKCIKMILSPILKYNYMPVDLDSNKVTS